MATNNIEKQSFGQEGATFKSSGSASGEFCAITMVEDTVFSSLTWAELDGDTITGSTTFSAGFTIYGQITAFELTSGKVLAYKAA